MSTDRLPPVDVLIAGAQKAGTSSLASYMAQHPAICTHERVEFSFFLNDRDYADGYEAAFRRHFAHCAGAAKILAKSVTVMTDPKYIQRAHAHNEDLRVLVALRNPVNRAYSAYWWARRKGYEDLPTFEEAIATSPTRHGGNVVKIRNTAYLRLGEYARQVEDLFRIIGRDQVKIVLSDDLQTDPDRVVGDAFAFIGLDPAIEISTARRRNTASQARIPAIARLLNAQSPLKRRFREVLPQAWADRLKRRLEGLNTSSFEPPPMDPATRQLLVTHFAPHNERLAKLIGRDLSRWAEGSGVRRPLVSSGAASEER